MYLKGGHIQFSTQPKKGETITNNLIREGKTIITFCFLNEGIELYHSQRKLRKMHLYLLKGISCEETKLKLQ